MSMLLLLLATNDSAAEIGPSVAQELGALGVTRDQGLRPVLESSLPANGRPTTQGRTR